MKFLLFLLGLIFFFIFFLFSRLGGIEGFLITNLYWIAHVYIGISLLLVMSIVSENILKNSRSEDSLDTMKYYIPTKEEIGLFIKEFFSNYVYYIACTLFYTALYFIIKALYSDIDISILFLFLNIVVISLYFIEHKFTLFQDFTRVNLVLISLYYIGKHVLYIAGFSYQFTSVDVINIIGVFILFLILLGSSRSRKYHKVLTDYFIAFSFLEISTFYKFFFGGEMFSLGIIAGIVGGIFLIFTSEIHKFFLFSKEKIRYWGILFTSCFIGVSYFYIGEEDIFSLILIPLFWGGAYLLYMFHKTFQNYVALCFGSLGIIGGFYGIYTVLLSEASEKLYLHFFLVIFSGAFLLFDNFFENPSIYNKYFFHILSLLVNVLGVFCFFFFSDVSILPVGILLLVESLYLFFSYYTISHIKKTG